MSELLPRVAEVLDAYLRALETGDAPNRETLLARHPDLKGELGAALDTLDFVHRASHGLAGAKGGEDAAPGKALGDYHLLREIGRGGMAVVYEAQQVSLGRRVALKVLPFAAVLDPKQLQRFKNEAMAAAHLRHPNIVPVYGVGCERGVHYYAMQYVEGQSLAAAIRDLKGGGTGEGTKTPISSHGSNREPAYIRMAAALGVQAAEALDHAHELGIVHRDVKPGNLLVDAIGTLWVTDFGLARSLNDVGLTMTGEILGTIRYMSPEQALAKRVPIDHRTDVYSLGATLYELFTLEPAFPGDDPHVVIQDIATKEPAPPRKLNPALPRDLETVLLKAMSKDPASRYSTAQEMADDLKRFLEDRPIEARRPGFVRRTGKWGRRHRGLVTTAIGVLVLAVAGLAAATALVWREKQRAETNLDLALRAMDQIYVDEAEGILRIREGLPHDMLERGIGFYEAFARENVDSHRVARLTGRVHHRAALICRALGQPEQAGAALDRAISAYREVVRQWPRDAEARGNLGLALFAKGDLDGAIQELRGAIHIDPDFAASRNALGVMLLRRGEVDAAIEQYREAIRITPDCGPAHNNLGDALRVKGDLVNAIAECREAIRISPDSAPAYYALGWALSAKGRADDAIAAYREAVRLKPGMAEAHSSLGNELRDVGRVEEAISELREAVRLMPDWAGAHYNLANALKMAGNLDDAITEIREAIRLGALRREEADPGPWPGEDPDPAEAHDNLGRLLMDKGDAAAAAEAFRAAVRLRPDWAEAHFNLGAASCRVGDVRGQLECHRKAVEIRPDWAWGRYGLGNALKAAGDPDGAIPEYREAIRLAPDFAEARCNLGVALWVTHRKAEAIAEFRKAIDLKPELAEAHDSLACALWETGNFDAATREYEETVRLRPGSAEAHRNLGLALKAAGSIEQAIAEFRRAIELKPDFAEACCDLGLALGRQGHYQDAVSWLRKGHDLGSKRPDWALPSKDWVETAEGLAEMERRMDRALSGEALPRDPRERIDFAEMLRHKARHADAARMYSEALVEDPTLAEDIARGHRYNAARSAVLAAASESDAARWRDRALEWLRADLGARGKDPDTAPSLEPWKRDPDLAGVRDRIDDLPEAEREAWRSLWAAVDEALLTARPASR